MPEKGKTTLQLYSIQGGMKVVDRLWLESIQYKNNGVMCVERDKPNTYLFIPYENIKLITFPRDTNDS